MRRALVVGGGVAGLAAAVALAELGVDTELWEAAPVTGGKLRTSPFAGVSAVDEGADAYLTRVPHAVAFAARIGLGTDQLTAPEPTRASVWHGRLHDLPGGMVLGVPTALRPFVTTGLLSWRGKLRAAAEPLLPRRAGRNSADSLGALVRGRFGDEVHERLVDTLVGSIYATDTDRFSLTAVPQLAQLAANHRSLLLGARSTRRSAPAPAAPIFAAPRAGMAALVAAASERFVASGGHLRTGRQVVDLQPTAHGAWHVDGELFDHVVLAAPARVAAQLLGAVAPEAAATLARIEYADVAMVRIAVPADGWPVRLAGRSGYLVPKPDQRLVTAASFGSQKWAHWRPTDGAQVLRVSLGRDGLPIDAVDDDTLVAAAVNEVGRHLELDLQPIAVDLTRWRDAFAQYRPYHHELVADAERQLPRGVHLAGASYHGIGIPSCIASGLKAAENVAETAGGGRR